MNPYAETTIRDDNDDERERSIWTEWPVNLKLGIFDPVSKAFKTPQGALDAAKAFLDDPNSEEANIEKAFLNGNYGYDLCIYGRSGSDIMTEFVEALKKTAEQLRASRSTNAYAPFITKNF